TKYPEGRSPTEAEIRERDKNINSISGGALGKTFRHYAYQAYLTALYGSADAKKVGDFYELNSGSSGDDRNFDLINNERGREIGKQLKSKFDVNTAIGLAGFLNAIVDIVREEDGLPPLEDNEKYFNETNVKTL